MLGLGLDSWNNIMLICLGIGGVAAIAVGVSTYAVVRLQKQEALAAAERIEDLRADNLKLEARIAPRRLSGEQVHKMSAILSSAPPLNIAVVSRLLDFEGKDFADDIASVLNNSHWKPVRYENWTQSDKGVFIATAEGTQLLPEVGALITALDAANIEHKTITISGDDLHRMSPWFEPGVMYLLVGAKP